MKKKCKYRAKSPEQSTAAVQMSQNGSKNEEKCGNKMISMDASYRLFEVET